MSALIKRFGDFHTELVKEYVDDETLVKHSRIWDHRGYDKPQRLQDPAFCELLVKEGLSLGFVPNELKTLEICKLAIKRDGCALEHTPMPWRTEEICKLAVSNNGDSLFHVPHNLRNEEMVRLAVSTRGSALEFVPLELRTEEICKIAVGENNREATRMQLDRTWKLGTFFSF